jgi:acyl carrier protein
MAEGQGREPMDEAQVREQVRAVIAEMAPLRGEAIDGDASLIVDLGFDSLGLVELATALEQEFGLGADEEDDPGLDSVADVEAWILGRLGEQAGAATGGAVTSDA